jgi:PAS domain-containing protein
MLHPATTRRIECLAYIGVGVATWMNHRWVITPLALSGQAPDRNNADTGDLGASKEQFYPVFNVSPDWIVITELDSGVIVDASEGFENISGYARNDVIGRPAPDLNIWPDPTLRAAIVDQLRQDGGVRHALV